MIEGCLVRFSRKDNMICHFNSHKKKLAAASKPVVFKKNLPIPDRKVKKAPKPPSPIETVTSETTKADVLTPPVSAAPASRHRSFSLASDFPTELVYSNPEHQRTLSSLSFASQFMPPLDTSRSSNFSFASESIAPIEIPKGFNSKDQSVALNHPHSRNFSFASDQPVSPGDSQNHSRCFSFASQLVSPAETACNEENFGFFSDMISPTDSKLDPAFTFENVYRERVQSFASELPGEETNNRSRCFSYASELPVEDTWNKGLSFTSEFPSDDNQPHSQCFSFASQIPTPAGDNGDTFQDQSISLLSTLTFEAPLNDSLLSTTNSVNTPNFSFQGQSPQSGLVGQQTDLQFLLN